MKKILGLDLGTNSIGWAVINASQKEDNTDSLQNISSCGSRIIPMDAAILGDFDKGNSKSQTAERTRLRGVRRLLERSLLRRERLHRVLSLMGFLPKHYARQIDRYGKFIPDSEPKLPWIKTENGKYQFIFQDSFLEMLTDFQLRHPELIANGKKVPYDWTIYYLRKKALTQKISKEELAWLILNFNQKRGYYQLRGEEEEEDSKKRVEYYALRVVSVENTGEKKGKDTWYNIHLENGWIYRRSSNVPLDWSGKIKEFVVTTELDETGNPKIDKDGNVKRSFRAPKEDDWNLLKKKSESIIDQSKLTVGTYIYESLLNVPNQKIRGKLIRTIERKYYKEELKTILEVQKNFHPELNDQDLYYACVNELYPSNESHREMLSTHDFTYLLIEDMLFYQRPLKSKVSLIADCPYEARIYKDKEGNKCSVALKCIAKSHPLFQEFRLWQFISNLRIYQREKKIGTSLKTDVDVTSEFLRNEDDYVALFDWLYEQKDISQKKLLGYKPFQLKKNEQINYRWNYVEDKLYPCNETRWAITSRLEKIGISSSFLTKEMEESLWHILYSITDKQEIEKALQTFADKHQLDTAFVSAFAKIPPFEKEYSAYSQKAIKKLLSLMRMGKYWSEKNIDLKTQERIEKILSGVCDETIRMRVRDLAFHLQEITSFKGLPLWLACYVVYDRHSESTDIDKWEKPSDIDEYLKAFKQHSLRNPIVEQVITETLRTVRDIWKQEGKLDEIHIELGREMKNPADKRAKMTAQALENENTNLRIKALLTEFMNPEFEIENVRPYSLSQQEILRIYEDFALSNESNIPDDVALILKKFRESDVHKRPTRSEVLRYKLWLEQKYRSPYTGEIIPLGKLFTPAFEIEHIIPQSRYFDDSLTNKVICESAVNKLKDNSLGYEFIQKHHGEKVALGNGKQATIFSVEDYEAFVKQHYAANRAKMEKLLLEDIPEKFIERQLNDSRYISKVVKSLLSNIVREENEQEAISKNIIVCTGGITDRLKRDWGIMDIWNKIILPRFQRLNKLQGTNDFTTISAQGHEIPAMPLYLQKGFNKKRIDHRHHAMDAIIIACANRNIVNYLNNASALKGSTITRYDLQHILCEKTKINATGNYQWVLRKPWETFPQDVYQALKGIVVSFKQNLRVINRTTNHYLHYDATGKKVLVKQTKGDSWAIRQPMHKDTVFGEVNLRMKKTVSLNEALKQITSIVDKDLKHKLQELIKNQYDVKQIKKYFEDQADVWQDINLKKIEVYYYTQETKDRYFATRKPLDTSFDRKKIKESVTDTGIQKILLNHLERNQGKAEIAFSPDGIDQMNQDIISLNDGKSHQPIYKVRYYEKADKFAIGKAGNKSRKFVEAAKGTNLFFAVYETTEEDKKTGNLIKKRSYASIPLNVVISRQKRGLPSAPENENGDSPVFVLSPNNLVYVPKQEELNTRDIQFPIDRNRIYKMVSSTGSQCFFIKQNIANMIWDKNEFSSLNKMEKAITGEMIKEVCIPLRVDRLGNISLLNQTE